MSLTSAGTTSSLDLSHERRHPTLSLVQPPNSTRPKTPETSPKGTSHKQNSIKEQQIISSTGSSTLLEIPGIQKNGGAGQSRSPTRTPKDRSDLNLPTIRTEGPSPTSNFAFSGGRGTIKEARSRRRKPWRKLMWVKQNYPDNYTDATFLDSLQRNVNFRAYDFWSLVYDSTVIIQHLATVVVFVCAFIAISLEKIGPVYVAGSSTVFTVVGWLIWDGWSEEEQALFAISQPEIATKATNRSSDDDKITANGGPQDLKPTGNNTTSLNETIVPRSRFTKNSPKSRSSSLSPKKSARPQPYSRSLDLGISVSGSDEKMEDFGKPLSRSVTSPTYSSASHYPAPPPSPPPRPSRVNRQLSTLKSALLIYSTLLGLSPILKSLTRTTTSDSIWALSSWLFLVNLLCFDYGLGEAEAEGAKKGNESGSGPPGLGPSFTKKLPTSLSTTTALAASVVLASRLTETGAVFSLLLFSIQNIWSIPLIPEEIALSIIYTSYISDCDTNKRCRCYYAFCLELAVGVNVVWTCSGWRRRCRLGSDGDAALQERDSRPLGSCETNIFKAITS